MKTIQQKLDTPFKVRTPNLPTIKDVDLSKRIVTGMYNAYNYFDSDNDVLIMGVSKKSIQEHGPDSKSVRKIKHAKNHDLTQLPGKIEVLKETEIDGIEGIYFETKMANTTLGNDTLIEYQEGILDQHSIGFRYLDLELVEPDGSKYEEILGMIINPADADGQHIWIVKEIELYEGSTVAIGANELTPFLGIKSNDKRLQSMKLIERIDKLEKQLRDGRQSDQRMFDYELQLKQLKQMLMEIFGHTHPSTRQGSDRADGLNFAEEISKVKFY